MSGHECLMVDFLTEYNKILITLTMFEQYIQDERPTIEQSFNGASDVSHPMRYVV